MIAPLQQSSQSATHYRAVIHNKSPSRPGHHSRGTLGVRRLGDSPAAGCGYAPTVQKLLSNREAEIAPQSPSTA